MKLVAGFDPGSISKKLTVKRIDPDISFLSENQLTIIDILIECSAIMNDLFHMQVYPDYHKRYRQVVKSGNKPLELYFHVMNGPFDQFNNNAPFIQNVEKNEKGGFYPADLTMAEWNKAIKAKKSDHEGLLSPFTVITREDGKLKPIPYSEYYQEKLEEAAVLLDNAAEFADNYSLKSYFSAQANAFRNNDFIEADIRWVQLTDNDIEPLLGAHEFYEDRFLGYKAAFTAVVTVKKKTLYKKLSFIQKICDVLQENLPVPSHYKKQKRGSISQIDVVDLVYNGGDARGPIQTAAYNLPNSQVIRQDFGSKKVLLYNIMEAKFETVMKPLAELILESSISSKVTFDAYFNFILMHEVSHELGIGLIKDSEGNMREVSYFLKDLYTIIEETKADVMGVFTQLFLIKQGLLSDSTFIETCATYVISLVRSLRFGADNVHGLANIIQWNFLHEEGIIISGSKKDELLSIDLHRFERAIEKLLTILLTLQGEGDYSKTRDFIKKYDSIKKELKKYVERMDNLPVDILPWYPYASETEPVFDN
jgi:hypothetical protein